MLTNVVHQESTKPNIEILDWVGYQQFSRPCCIKSSNFLRMVSLMTKEEQGVSTLVGTLRNHLSSIFKFTWVPFTLWFYLQIVRLSF